MTGMHHLAFCGIISRNTIHIPIMSEGEKKKTEQKNIESNNDKELPKINVRHLSTQPANQRKPGKINTEKKIDQKF